MTASTITPYRSDMRAGRDGFAQLLHAEWTKFRTVPGWVTGLAVAAMVTVLLGLVAIRTYRFSTRRRSGKRWARGLPNVQICAIA